MVVAQEAPPGDKALRKHSFIGRGSGQHFRKSWGGICALLPQGISIISTASPTGRSGRRSGANILFYNIIMLKVLLLSRVLASAPSFCYIVWAGINSLPPVHGHP